MRYSDPLDTAFRGYPARVSQIENVTADSIVLLEIAATAKSVSPFISFAIT
jgi:hypothetical protein